MVNKVYIILKPLRVPIKWLKRPPFDASQIAISYHFFNEGDLIYGDGSVSEEGGALQVDIFSKVDYSSTIKEVKRLLKGAGFLFADGHPDAEEKLDDNTTVYHKILIFNYVESVVKLNVE